MRRIKVIAAASAKVGRMQCDPSDSRPTVYLVDDDAAVCRALAFALDLDGFDVKTCRSAEALLDLDLPAAGAVLVLDQRLPGLSGLEVLGLLRDQGLRLPAVLVTSHPAAALRDAAVAAGVSILEKPLMGDTLASTIRRELARTA